MYRIVEIHPISLRFISSSFVLLGLRVTTFFFFFLGGGGGSLRFYMDLFWYCVKLWPLQRVVIIPFVTDREAIEKSKILYSKGFLPLIYCPLVCSKRFKCIFITFVIRATAHAT